MVRICKSFGSVYGSMKTPGAFCTSVTADSVDFGPQAGIAVIYNFMKFFSRIEF